MSLHALLDHAAEAASALHGTAQILDFYGNTQTAHALRLHGNNLLSSIKAVLAQQDLLQARHDKASDRRFSGEPITGFDQLEGQR